MSTRKHNGLRPAAAALCLLILGGTLAVDASAANAATPFYAATLQTREVPNQPLVRAVKVVFPSGNQQCVPLSHGSRLTNQYGTFNWRSGSFDSSEATAELTSMATQGCAPGTGFASTSATVDISKHRRYTVYPDRRPKMNL
jgi:hypothetical protein